MAFARDQSHKFRGTLGLDIGSETTRAAIRFMIKERWGNVVTVQYEEAPVRPQRGTKYDQDDFTSLCNLTGGDDVEPYVGNGDPRGDDTTTIKVAIQLITDAEDSSLDQSPLMRIINQIREGGPMAVEKAKRRGMRALEALLERVLHHAREVCTMSCCYIDIVSFTVPAQWHTKAQDFLTDTIRRVFGLDQDFKVGCLFEIDACCQFYLNDKVAKETVLDAHMRKHGNAHVLLVDAGGYSMNTCIQHVYAKMIEREILDDDDDGDDDECEVDVRKYKVYHVSEDDPAGQTGGSGHWNYEVRQYFKRQMRENGTYNEEVLQMLEDQFDTAKYEMTDTEDVSFYTQRGLGELRKEDIKPMWDAAHGATLELLESKIKLLLSISANHLIVVTGGSSHHPWWQAAVKAICAKHNVCDRNLVLTHNVDSKARTLRLPKGLNYAIDKRISVVDYFKGGGGFAVRFDTKPMNKELENRAGLLLDHTSPADPTAINESKLDGYRLHDIGVTLKEHKKWTHVKVVGFPLTQEIEWKLEHGGTRYRHVGPDIPVYDFLYLGKFRPGVYHFNMTLTRVGWDGDLRLTVTMEEDEALGNAVREAVLEARVYHYVSAGCVLCYDVVEDLDDKISALREQLWGSDEKRRFQGQEDDSGEFQCNEKIYRHPEGAERSRRSERTRKSVNYSEILN